MAVVRRNLLRSIVVVLLAAGLLTASDVIDASAGTPPVTPELGAICVQPYTAAVSAAMPLDGGTNCPASFDTVQIPDDFPFILSISPWTSTLYLLPSPIPGWGTISLPEAGSVTLCVSQYTRQLAASRNATCPGGFVPVLLVGEIGPDAVDDGPYTTLVTTTLTTPAPGLLENDHLGIPAATIVSFGGGSLPGDASTHLVGTTLVGGLAGGDLTVNADGSFTLANPSQTGDYSFRYRLQNSADSDDATVTIQVQQLPTAVDDGPYTLLEGDDLDIGLADPNDLLENDTLGFPEAVITGIGGGDLIGPANPGDSTPLGGGTLTVNADGSFSLVAADTAGTYSFEYTLDNLAGSDTATVTIQVQRGPDAVDDGPYSMTVGTTLDVPNVTDEGLLANDDRGFPAGVITSISGGDLTGPANAGDPAALAGGTLTVNSDGSFTLVNPDQTGSFSFNYTLTNPAGSDDATVTIEILGPPLANDDGPAPDSAPGDLFHTALSTTLNSTQTAGDDNLLSNDDLGFPVGDIVSFGGGDLGGDVELHDAGTTVSPLVDFPDGSLSVNADGSFIFDPPTGFTGLYSFEYRLENTAGASDATVTIAVGVRPDAVDDTYASDVLGNVRINTATSSNFSVLTNDEGDGLTITAFDATSSQGGNVTVNGNGTFIYDPPAGFEGSDSFGYTIDNGFGDPQTGTVDLTVSGMIWFVDVNDATAGGDGRLSNPFDCLVGGPSCFDQVAADESGDSIFLASGSYTGGLTLLAGQKFVGAGASASISVITGLTPPADSTLPSTGQVSPQIATGAVDAVVLGSTNTVRGLNIGNTGTGDGIDGSNFGTLTLSEVAISGTGRALNLSNGTVNATFSSIAVTSSGSQGINLNLVAGTFTVSGTTTIAGTTGDGIAINASPATIAFQGATTIDNAGVNGINLTGGNGTVTFTSIDLDTIGIVGLLVQGNTNPVNINGGSIGAINDPGGNAVDIDQGSANITIASTVAKATGGEVVDVTGRTGGMVIFSNTLSCTSSCAGMNIANNTAGSTGFTGLVTTNTGAQTAVNLTSNTGHTVTFSGGLNIDTTSGTGFNATGGGTVQVLNGNVVNDVDATTGIAVNIVSTTISAQGVTFTSVSSNGGSNPGINLSATGTLGGFTVTGTGIAGTGGTIANKSGAGDGTDGIVLNTVKDVSLAFMNITNNNRNGIFGTSVDGFSLNGVVVDGNADQASPDEAGLHLLELVGTATITNSTVRDSHENNVKILNSSGTLNLQVTNSTFEFDTNSTQLAHNLLFVGTGTSNMTIGVSGSTFDGLRSGGNVVSAAGVKTDVADTGIMDVTVQSSTFRDNNVAVDMGLSSGSPTLTFDVLNNPTMTGNRALGINLFTNANGTGNATGTISGNTVGTQGVLSSGSQIGSGIRIANEGGGTVTALIENNTVQEIGDGNVNGFEAIIASNSVTASTLNVTITNNTIDQIRDDRGLVVNQIIAGGTINASISGNTFTNVAGISGTVLRVRQTAGTFNVTQLDPAGVASPNRLDTINNLVATQVSVAGTINFNQAAPPLP